MPAPSEPAWVFDDAPASGARRAGLAMAHVIPGELDKFVREVLQNARDQRRDEETVKVRFTFLEFSGGLKEGFLQALGWDELKPHIENAADEGGVTIGPQLRRALDVVQSERLLVLRIEDSGTLGLVGGEDEHGEGTNFNPLCRDELVTGESSDTRGGSFGLGKSVLWRFSVTSTVLFSSRISQGRRSRLRLFGRVELPFHVTDGQEWRGQGYWGLEETRPSGKVRAISVWDDEAEEAARQLHLFRGIQLGTGTSILLVGFFEPSGEQPRRARDIGRDVLDSATRWFWPSLIGSPQACAYRWMFWRITVRSSRDRPKSTTKSGLLWLPPLLPRQWKS
jgi:hypothetical protein